MWFLQHELLLLHYKYLGFERTFRRHALYCTRQRTKDLVLGWGVHYSWSREELHAERVEQNLRCTRRYFAAGLSALEDAHWASMVAASHSRRPITEQAETRVPEVTKPFGRRFGPNFAMLDIRRRPKRSPPQSKRLKAVRTLGVFADRGRGRLKLL